MRDRDVKREHKRDRDIEREHERQRDARVQSPT